MAEDRDKHVGADRIDREEIARAARDPEAAKRDGAAEKLFGEGMTTPDSTKIPYTSEGEPDYGAVRGTDAEPPSEATRLGRKESER